MYTLKDITNGQAKAKANHYNTDLFVSDREQIESFDKSAYSDIFEPSLDNKHDKQEHDKLIETIVAVGHESDFYLITAVHTSFNGEEQVSLSEQQITLKGFNYFTKENKEDFTEVYNNFLAYKGYEITTDDIKALGELNTEYNVTTLSFTDDKDSKHYLTVNSRDQLSSVTVKHSAREVKTKSTFQSAFR